MGRARCDVVIGTTEVLGKSIDKGESNERVVASNLMAACRSSVTAGLIECV